MNDLSRSGLPARPGMAEIIIVVPSRMADGLKKMAIEAKQKPAQFVSNLLAAAYSSRIMDTGDKALERAVRGDLESANALPEPDKKDEEISYLRLSLKGAEQNAKTAADALEQERAATVRLRDKIAEFGRKFAEKEAQAAIPPVPAPAPVPAPSTAELDALRADFSELKQRHLKFKAEIKDQVNRLEMRMAEVAKESRDARASEEILRSQLIGAKNKLAAAKLSPPPMAEGAQMEADLLSKTDISTIKAYASAGNSVAKIASKSGVSVDAVKIVIGRSHPLSKRVAP